MKYTIKILLTIFILSTTLLSCKAKTMDTTGKIKVAASIFPEYDWLMNIAGPVNDKIIPKLIVKNGVDIHSFQPSATDIVNISSADILIYVGGESDKWISDVLKNPQNPDMIVINLMNLKSAEYKEEELVEGMQAEESETEDSKDQIEPEYDEHVWFSIDIAKSACENLADALIKLDPENAQNYTTRLASYKAKLDLLDSKYKSTISKAKNNTIVVCDRFPFAYISHAYGLNYYAAFAGCSAETEASFETVTFLSNKIDELDTNKVFIIDGSKDKLAKTIIHSTKKHKLADILVLDSMQSTTLANIMNGKTYIGTMEDNLALIEKALN